MFGRNSQDIFGQISIPGEPNNGCLKRVYSGDLLTRETKESEVLERNIFICKSEIQIQIQMQINIQIQNKYKYKQKGARSSRKIYLSANRKPLSGSV